MNIRILKKSFGGEFVPERAVLRLGGKGSAQVETLVFELPPEWKGKAVTIHVQHLDGTLPNPILLDGENSAAVDKTFTASAKGLWMLKAVDTGGYCALTRPSKYECYETFSTEGEEEITPSMYEAFVAQVAENARQAKAAAKQAAESAEGLQEYADRAEQAAARAVEKADGVETFASAAKESAAAAKQSAESCADNAAAAAQSEQNAAESQQAAAGSAATAASAASSAVTNARAAASSASAAAESRTSAESSAQTATTSENAAKTSAESAAASAQQAKSDAETAKAAADKATAANTTDKTLSIEGVPADSKTVGDALRERYTMTEVDERLDACVQSIQLSGRTLEITFGDGSTRSYTTQDTTDLASMTGTLSTAHGGTGKSTALTAEDVGAVDASSSNYVKSVSVSGNTMTITRGDGTYITVALPSGGDIVSQSIGETDSYIRLSNGIQICWGFASYKYVTFLVPFLNDNSVGFASHLSYSGSTRLVNATKSILSSNFLDWIAIGLWK